MRKKNLKPLLSIIIPVFNVENFLKDTLESIINQSFKNLEIIAVNDGSTDASAQVLHEYAKKDDAIKVIEQENKGLSYARNVGFTRSRGKYVYFLDSDDMLTVDSLDKLINFAEKVMCDVVCFYSKAIDEEGNKLALFSSKKYSQPNPISGEQLYIDLNKTGNYSANVQKYLYRRSFLISHNIRFDEGYIHEDESFSVEALCLADRAAAMPDQFLKKRFRSGSIMAVKRTSKNAEGWGIAAKRLINFKEENTLRKETITFIDKKIFQLIKNSVKLNAKLKGREKSVTSKNQQLLPDGFNEGGIKLSVYVQSFILYIRIKCMLQQIVSKIMKR